MKDYTVYSKEELIGMMKDLEARLEESENDCGILTTEVQRLKSLAEGAANSETQAAINSLEAAVAEKDAIIESQKKKLDESSAVIAKKDEIIDNKDKTIGGFIQQSLMADEKLKFLEVALKSANEEADSKRAEVKKLEASNAEKDKIIASLRADAGKAMHPVKTKSQVDAQGNPPQGNAFRPAGNNDLAGSILGNVPPVSDEAAVKHAQAVEAAMKRRQQPGSSDALDAFMDRVLGDGDQG